MSGSPSSAPKQALGLSRRETWGGAQSSSTLGDNHQECYKHAVTDTEAALLTTSGNPSSLEEIQKRTGAQVQFDLDQSPVQGTKMVVIRGSRSQIEDTVRLINQTTGAQILAQEMITAQAEAFWLEWVLEAFPDLDSRTYFLPPVYVNRVPMTRGMVASLDVLVLQATPSNAVQDNQSSKRPPTSDQVPTPRPSPVQESDVRDDGAMQRVFLCLREMSNNNKETLVAVTQLQFGDYLGEPCYSAAAAQMPLPKTLPPDKPRQWKYGDFDIILIHREYGFVVCEVKAIGEKVSHMTEQELHDSIGNKLKQAVSQLDKAETMLSHLVSDIDPDLRITKTMAFPNLTAKQVQQAIASDPHLTQELCGCLGTADPTALTRLCLCSDQLSEPDTPSDVNDSVLRELGEWWHQRVASPGPDSHMTLEIYKKLVARFCGPATTVTVPCIYPPRRCVKTLAQAVSLTGECYAQITLFPEQVHLLNTAPPRVFLSGPPGTGKTVVLQLMGTEWLRHGHHVYVVSTWEESRAVCCMLLHVLQQTVSTRLKGRATPDRLHLLQYDLAKEEDVEKAVSDLTEAASEGSLYVIVDEARLISDNFRVVCDKLLTQVPHLHLWAASCYSEHVSSDWQLEYLTRPLRSPPAIVRQVKVAGQIVRDCLVRDYKERGAPDHTDGPPVRNLYHRGRGHSGSSPLTCVQCGQEVARILRDLRVGLDANSMMCKDVLVLCSFRDVSDTSSVRVLKGLRDAGFKVRVVTKDDDIEDVATARSDVVWLAHGDDVRGLERKVIVCLGEGVSARLHHMSRCTSQLVIVSPR